ncbi:Oxalate:formate antiporter [Schistosoma japonicum]|uniref:Oxalate:formate antiporter n=1 Tax=Schistosoma japonicum TaxID=6182 RepID=A0A4Z2DWV1_SCHJA|nr:Oxalate:formate antiporter [Schistosoma japonicum]TNN20917.1 Oxalate:formate antiporter [Schistosoma japonicum]
MKEETKSILLGCIAVAGGILIHFTFGYFYTVANMVPYIMGYIQTLVDENISDQAAIWLSAVALAVQGISMPIGGIIADKLGFRLVVAVSCLATSGGVLLTYFTIQKTYIGVVITYSVLMGSGLGLGYSVVLATAASWFPKRRGLVVGMVVGGFGLGALVFTPIQTALINPNNVQVNNVTRRFSDPEVLNNLPSAFLILGGILLTIQLIGFAALRPKPKSNNSGNSDPDNQPHSPMASYSHSDKSKLSSEVNIGPKQVFRYIDFYLLWCIMFCDIIPITIITSAYKLFGQTVISDDRFLSAVATASSLFNCAGRIIWGAVVDRVSFKIPMCTMLIIWSVILITFPHISSLTGITLKVFYTIWVLLLFFSLSGTFVIQPSATAVLFGSTHMAVNYGLIFSAFVSY